MTAEWCYCKDGQTREFDRRIREKAAVSYDISAFLVSNLCFPLVELSVLCYDVFSEKRGNDFRFLPLYYKGQKVYEIWSCWHEKK